MHDKFSELISYITIAANNCALYGKKHPAVESFSRRACENMEGLYTNDALSLMILRNSLVFNNDITADSGAQTNNIIKILKRKGIDKIVITKGVDTDEFSSFISDIASPGRTSASYPHISIGSVEVRVKADGDVDVSTLMDENILKVKEVYGGISRLGRLDMAGIEDVVINLISTLDHEADIFRVVIPVTADEEN
jgi:hypothetical protein